MELVAAGALFRVGFGPPVNFHGLNEGAPLDDLRQSVRILYQIMLGEIADTAGRQRYAAARPWRTKRRDAAGRGHHD